MEINTEIINEFCKQEQLAAYQSMCRDMARVPWAEDPRPVYGPYNYDPRPIYGPPSLPTSLHLVDAGTARLDIWWADLEWKLQGDGWDILKMTPTLDQWRELRDFITEHILEDRPDW